MSADSQSLDALDWVYDVLSSAATYIKTGVGTPSDPIPIVKGLPGYPGAQYIGVIVLGQDSTGPSSDVKIGIDLWTQEVGIGTDAPMFHILELVDRIKATLYRQSGIGGNPHVGAISWASEFEVTENKTFFYNVTMTVPVRVGGGL